MNIPRFLELAEAYGADVGRWPADEQPAARALFAADLRAAAILAEVRRFDDRFGSVAAEPVPEGLEQKILASLCARQAATQRRTAWASAGVSLAVIVTGALVGALAAPSIPGWGGRGEPAGAGGFEQTSFGRLIAENAPESRRVRTS